MFKCVCDPGGKQFASRASYRQHLKSKKHQLFMLRDQQNETDLFRTQIEMYVSNETKLKQKLNDLERQLDAMNEEIGFLKHSVNVL